MTTKLPLTFPQHGDEEIMTEFPSFLAGQTCPLTSVSAYLPYINKAFVLKRSAFAKGIKSEPADR